jgi:YkoY family integral membrane protein
MLHDLATIGILVILEGVLSIDNALVLAVLARSVKPELQKKVLTYGLAGAIILRMGAVFAAQALLKSPYLKAAGALYLLYLALSHFLKRDESHDVDRPVKHRSFWTTIIVVEMTDLAFAVDSILAAVAMTDKYWVIITGGIMGTVMMRYAARLLITLLNKFPLMENTAFVLVGIIGLKLGIEALQLPGVDFHDKTEPWFWGQWISMIVTIAFGFRKRHTIE